ncbi:MAG: PQQ-binding-like beta-propeller repeat protein [Acidobacteriota bacterium]|nr:PQQ-binding-like beta-propeller repeat protein [Acidobacteriota bacterium]
MRRFFACAITIAVAAFMPLRWGGASAQDNSTRDKPRKANWLADGGDPQRTSWQKDEALITPASAKGMKLLWTVQTDNEPRQLHNLFAPLIVSEVTTANGPREIAILAGVSDNIYGIDVEKGTQIWKRHFDSTFEPPQGGRGYGPLCPGGMTATPVVAPMDTPGKYKIYAISWDGRLRQLDVATGQDLAPAELFLPPNGKPYALNLVNNVLYTTTAQGCGGNPNQFYAYDLATKKVGSFNPGSGGLWPRLGPSVGKDGAVYAGSGDGDYHPEQQIYGQAIISVKQNPETKALELKDWYAPTNAFWLRKRDLDMNVTGPLFDYKDKEYTVQSSKECRIWLLDTSALGGEDHRTPVYRTPLVCNEEVQFAAAGPWGALTTWEDSTGTRWILMPFWGPKHPQFKAPIEYGEVTQGAIAAFKMDVRAGKPQLTPAWLSRNMNLAEPAVVANGVVFGYGSGEDATQATFDIGLAYNTAANRAARSAHAVLYALDAQTGAELWSSGEQIKSFNHFSSLSVANGRVYIGTYDGKLYCFGVDRTMGGTR